MGCGLRDSGCEVRGGYGWRDRRCENEDVDGFGAQRNKLIH